MHKNENFYAFYYEDKDNYGEHFDEEGKTLRKAFLKAPLKFYRISSRSVSYTHLTLPTNREV